MVIRGPLKIMINTGMENASESYTYLSSQLPSNSIVSHDHNSNKLVRLFRLCASKYSLANGSLTSSLQDLGLKNYDYSKMHVMGVVDYTNVFHNAFKRLCKVTYRTLLKAREDGFKHIYSAVLGIIDQLSNINN